MLRTRWQKVLIDLWSNRARTLVVALAIAVGVYAVGVVAMAREMLLREYDADQAGALVASAIIHTSPFDDDLAERIAALPDVAAAEGRTVVRTRVTDDLNGARNLVLVAVPDFTSMSVDAIAPLDGKWPPGQQEVILERLAMDYLGAATGDTIAVELDNRVEKALTVVGWAHDPQQMTPGISDRAFGYIATESLASLGLEERYTEMRIRVADQSDSEQHIEDVVAEVEEQLERGGRQVFGKRIETESVARPFIDTVVLILTSLGALILLLSGFLVVNAISALITQQIPQIGVMKLVGARRWQIMSLYLATVLAYGTLAVVVGIPLAWLTARLLMTGFVEGLLNVMPDNYAVPVSLLLMQSAIGLLLPLVAGLVPVVRGTRITTHKALNDVGTEVGTSGHGQLERVLTYLQRARSVKRPILLSIRNTLRHKGRLVQTLVVLIVGTALFISVLSVRSSVDATLNSFMQFHRYDVSVALERPYRMARLGQAARQVEGVAGIEFWSTGRATRIRPDGSESDGTRVYAVPPDTALMAPQISEGRWLRADATRGIVVNSDFVEEEPDVRVGREIVLDIDGRETTWSVAGIVPTDSRGASIYMGHDEFARTTRAPGQATHVQVTTVEHDGPFQHAVEKQLNERFEAVGLEVSGTQTTQLINSENELLFTVVVAFLILMALLLAAVGGLGLATTMSINIMERVREIGVLRAIGASNASVRKIVLLEGFAMGLVSWVIGTLLSLPISAFMSEQLGLALINIPLQYHYSFTAAIVWFFVLQAVSMVASLGPAGSAVRLTVREVLAYE
jgi:putative ABC transport system permease protein